MIWRLAMRYRTQIWNKILGRELVPDIAITAIERDTA